MPGRGGARPPPPDSPRYPPRATELGPDAAADVVEGGDRGPRDGASFSSSAFCRTIAIAVAVATVAVVLGVVASSGGDGELLPGVGIKLPRWTYTAGGGGGGKRANPLTAAIVAHRARVRRARERVHHAAHDYARDDDDDDDDGDDDGDDGAGSTRGRRPRVLKDRRSPRERGRTGIRPEPGLVVLTTRSFGDATRGKTAIVLFRSVATPRVRNLRDAVLGSLKRHIPEGVVHVYGEVDVKDDSLLRMRYANAIHHAGRDEVRLLPIRPRSRCERRSLRTFPVVTLHRRRRRSGRGSKKARAASTSTTAETALPRPSTGSAAGGCSRVRRSCRCSSTGSTSRCSETAPRRSEISPRGSRPS